MSRQKYRKILIEIKKEIHTRQQKLIISIRGILIHCCVMVRGSVFREFPESKLQGERSHSHDCAALAWLLFFRVALFFRFFFLGLILSFVRTGGTAVWWGLVLFGPFISTFVLAVLNDHKFSFDCLLNAQCLLGLSLILYILVAHEYHGDGMLCAGILNGYIRVGALQLCLNACDLFLAILICIRTGLLYAILNCWGQRKRLI